MKESVRQALLQASSAINALKLYGPTAPEDLVSTAEAIKEASDKGDFRAADRYLDVLLTLTMQMTRDRYFKNMDEIRKEEARAGGPNPRWTQE